MSTLSSGPAFGRQHLLYFLPLPQGQGSLRPGLAIVVKTLEHGETYLCTQLYWGIPPFTTSSWRVIGTSQRKARRRGCRLCRGVLHSARYRRKPRGRLCRLGPEHDWRFSFCCARDGCRTRKTPPSLRFLGRKVYVAATIILAAVLDEGTTAARLQRLKELVGVDRRTVERWRRWWLKIFTKTSFWQIARAAFIPPVNEDELPTALLERFAGSAAERMTALLRFLRPITGGKAQAL